MLYIWLMEAKLEEGKLRMGADYCNPSVNLMFSIKVLASLFDGRVIFVLFCALNTQQRGYVRITSLIIIIYYFVK